MLETRVTIERSPETVWNYFTDAGNWRTWWDSGAKVAQWREGGRIEWEKGGASQIEAIVPGEMVRLRGAWMSTTFAFERTRKGHTVVSIEESAPRGGAFFRDGGEAHLAELQASLVKLKQAVERDTPKAQPAPQADGAVWPPVAAVLNLTGLGLGYAAMRRWMRWAIHLLITAGLVYVAFRANAAGMPTVWLVVFGLWLAWMVFDAGRVARRDAATPPGGAARRRWLRLALALLLVGVVAAGLYGYTLLGERAFAAGMTSYEGTDFHKAAQHFERVTTVYELTLSPNVAAADARIAECEQLMAAEDARQRGDYVEAVEAYQAYLDRYPESSLRSFVRDVSAETRFEWARHLREEGYYAAAIERYRTIMARYPRMDEAQPGAEAAASAAATYGEWAADLRSDGSYEQAVEKCQVVLDEFANTPAGEEMPAQAAGIYGAWADHLLEQGDYEAAVETYEIVLDEYPETPAGRRAAAQAAAAYAEWAAHLRRVGRHEEAVETYDTILETYPDTPSGGEARGRLVETYAEWAAALRDADEYEQAVETYQLIAEAYPNSEEAAQTTEEIRETHLAWASYLRDEGDYSDAIDTYDALLEGYGNAEISSTVAIEMGWTYNEWGQALRSEAVYRLAMTRFASAQSCTDDPDVVAAAEEGHQQALVDVSQDTGSDGRFVMGRAAEEVCEGQAASSPAIAMAADEVGKMRLEKPLFDLPSSIEADRPAIFHYVVCIEEGDTVLQRCAYSQGHTLVRQRRWWRLQVRRTDTAGVVAAQTFYGPVPDACPLARAFSSDVDYSSGGAPDTDEIRDWLQALLE